MWAPLTPPATNAVSPRPDSGRAATAVATTPVPKAMRTNVPKNSDRYSPNVVALHPAFGPIVALHAFGGRSLGGDSVATPPPSFGARGRPSRRGPEFVS